MGLLLAGAEGGNEFALSYIERNTVKLEYPWHWQAFNDLGSERASLGMGIGPIPYSAIRDYAREWRLSFNETQQLHYIVRAVDNHVLNKFAERQNKSNSKAK